MKDAPMMEEFLLSKGEKIIMMIQLSELEQLTLVYSEKKLAPVSSGDTNPTYPINDMKGMFNSFASVIVEQIQLMSMYSIGLHADSRQRLGEEYREQQLKQSRRVS